MSLSYIWRDHPAKPEIALYRLTAHNSTGNRTFMCNRFNIQFNMISKVLFNFIGHFQTKYHSIDMNVIKININKLKKKKILVCTMSQNSTISQFQHLKLLPGVVTMVTMKKILLYPVHHPTTVK